ncbi:MAG: hypothetical protein ABIB41_01660 [Nitrospirota bacterium]
MKELRNNPTSNKLGTGIVAAQLEKVIVTSGYPLQTVVRNLLTAKFQIQEEWSFTDSETQETRTIYLLAETPLFEFKEPQPRVRPALTLIIECKQSELPYIFFLSQSKPVVPKFPVISGLASDEIVITSDDDPSSWHFSVLDTLEMHKHSFLREAPEFCHTFSKCVRKGKDIELSGSQPYQGLVFPIVKAISHFKSLERPPATAMYFDCHLIIGLGVLDSPMVGVYVSKGGNSIVLLPWVRVLRHQPPLKEDEMQHRMNTFAIDVIHKDFLNIYIHSHLMPFAAEFSRLALKHQNVLASNKGFVSGMGKNPWKNIENRIEASRIQHKAKRIKATGRKLSTLISGKKEQE